MNNRHAVIVPAFGSDLFALIRENDLIRVRVTHGEITSEAGNQQVTQKTCDVELLTPQFTLDATRVPIDWFVPGRQSLTLTVDHVEVEVYVWLSELSFGRDSDGPELAVYEVELV